jgi:hypothetical protein
VRIQVSLLAAAAVTAVVSGMSSGAVATAATSNPVCVGAWVKTQFTGTTSVGPVCPVSWPGATSCATPSGGVSTLAAVGAEACLPSLEGARVSSSGA